MGIAPLLNGNWVGPKSVPVTLTAPYMRTVLVACAGGLFFLICFDTFSLGMGERLHLRYWGHAFPIVMSYLHHGIPWDFSAYQGIAEILVKAADKPAALHLAAQETEFDRSLVFIPSDDKGYTELSRLSFLLFGENVSSILKMWLSLFFGSTLIYLIANRGSIWPLILINLVLLGTHAALYAFPVSTELGEVTNPRALGLLSAVALCHLLVVMFRGRRLGIGGVLAVVAQSALIVFVFFCRSSEAWQIAAASAIAITFAVFFKRARQPSTVVLASLVICVIALLSYQKLTFNPAYFQTKGQLRLTWHNIGLGLALHPVLAQTYNLQADDRTMFRLVAAEATKAGTYDQIFTDRDKLLLNPISDFVAYDAIARAIVLKIVRDNPRSIVALFLYYKPIELLKTLLSAAGYTANATRPEGVAYIDPDRRLAIDAYYRFTRAADISALAIICLGSFFVGRWGLVGISSIVLILWTGSLVPAMVAYPLNQIIGFGFATTGACAYGLVFLMFCLIRKLWIQFLVRWPADRTLSYYVEIGRPKIVAGMLPRSES